MYIVLARPKVAARNLLMIPVRAMDGAVKVPMAQNIKPKEDVI